ncbi:mitotic-spindle organizing protein 1 [Petaurus breviceps papuanus]|uniref:mitotic-spindle organizing protein 1 n=1 Tax=Petaurus breviceps papuanus TaxID=3040969 RepID=UPI0036D9648C
MPRANQSSGLPGAQPIAAPSRPRTGQSDRNRVGNSNGNFALHAPIVTRPRDSNERNFMERLTAADTQREGRSLPLACGDNVQPDCQGEQDTPSCSGSNRSPASPRPWRAVAMAGSNSGAAAAAAAAAANLNAVRETMDVLLEISRILNTGLDMETLSICVRLCEQGINPEALSSVIKELRKATEALKAAENMTS